MKRTDKRHNEYQIKIQLVLRKYFQASLLYPKFCFSLSLFSSLFLLQATPPLYSRCHWCHRLWVHCCPLWPFLPSFQSAFSPSAKWQEWRQSSTSLTGKREEGWREEKRGKRKTGERERETHIGHSEGACRVIGGSTRSVVLSPLLSVCLSTSGSVTWTSVNKQQVKSSQLQHTASGSD